jgi:hypothetical protein
MIALKGNRDFMDRFTICTNRHSLAFHLPFAIRTTQREGFHLQSTSTQPINETGKRKIDSEQVQSFSELRLGFQRVRSNEWK